jgi:hypothetical protein
MYELTINSIDYVGGENEGTPYPTLKAIQEEHDSDQVTVCELVDGRLYKLFVITTKPQMSVKYPGNVKCIFAVYPYQTGMYAKLVGILRKINAIGKYLKDRDENLAFSLGPPIESGDIEILEKR